MFPRILEEAGIKRIKFHELRHTFGTMLNTLGVPPALIKAYMGHESINTTIDLYCHPTEKQKVEGIRFFGEAIDRLSVEKSVEKHSI
jgi:integrase